MFNRVVFRDAPSTNALSSIQLDIFVCFDAFAAHDDDVDAVVEEVVGVEAVAVHVVVESCVGIDVLLLLFLPLLAAPICLLPSAVKVLTVVADGDDADVPCETATNTGCCFQYVDGESHANAIALWNS